MCMPWEPWRSYAGHPVRTALEIGAGTGKATRLLAQRGVTVTATEPDGAMLAELLKHVPATVKTVQAAFEDVRPDESYGLVYAAASLHWTNPQGRRSRRCGRKDPRSAGRWWTGSPTAGSMTYLVTSALVVAGC
jgi:SAM-dependent methyltransferase